MTRIRSKIIAAFFAATVPPLVVTLWLSSSLIERGLSYSAIRDVDQLSRSLESTGRELYRQSREILKRDAAAHAAPEASYGEEARTTWPAEISEFASSGKKEQFTLAGPGGGELRYLVRQGPTVLMYQTDLHGVKLGSLSTQYSQARAQVSATEGRDLKRGFTYTLISVAGAIWLVSCGLLAYWAVRLSRPMQQLTRGLSAVAAGHLETRLSQPRNDELGAAMAAFNDMAAQLQNSRDRLIYVTRLESWQLLARKTAHEVKNSLTPIRLTMEELAARDTDGADVFLQQSAQIVVDEVTGLERRVRAFSEFSSEPPVTARPLDLNLLLEERIGFLRTAHPDVIYSLRLAGTPPLALADEDLVRGVITNLLENAAHAAQPGGVVLGVTGAAEGQVALEVHDSGPGVSREARGNLFEPTISFKPGGMGLGLSIARKSARLSGGDIALIPGELGGAAFRVLLPAAP